MTPRRGNIFAASSNIAIFANKITTPATLNLIFLSNRWNRLNKGFKSQLLFFRLTSDGQTYNITKLAALCTLYALRNRSSNG